MSTYATDIVLKRSLIALEIDQNNISATESDIEIVDKKCEMGCQKGDNFLGEIVRVLVSYTLRGSSPEVKTVSLIIKVLDHDQANGVFLKEMNVYSKESYCYETILPMLGEIAQNSRFGPKCYYTQEHPQRLIVMADLKAAGFVMKNRQTGMDYEHCKLALERLASFHAASMVLVDRQPELMTGFDSGMCTLPVIIDAFYKNFLNRVICLLASWTDHDPEYAEIRTKLIKLRLNYHEVFKSPLRTENDPYRVLNHGDIWVNNILFKEHAKTGQPLDMRMLDFQLSFYTSPGYDLNYFLIMSPDLATRQTREHDLLEAYRVEFNKSLKEYKYSQGFELSEGLLRDVMKQKAIYGFNMMLTTFPAILRNGEAHEGDSTAMFRDEEQRQRVVAELVENELFINYLRFHLKKFNSDGVFDVEY